MTINNQYFTIMKKLLFIFAAALMAASCGSGDGYTIKGTITGDSDKLVNGTAYLFNRDGDNPVRDTVEIINGKFKFTGTVTSPEPFIITVDGVPGMLSIFLENAGFTVTASEDNLAEATVTGGAAQTMMNRYNDGAKAIAEKYAIEDVVKVLRSADATEEDKDAASKTYEEYQAEVESMKDALVAEAPVSHFALFFLTQDYYYMDVNELAEKVAAYKADPAFAGNNMLAKVDNYVQKELALAPGNPAPDFTLNNTKGNPLTLSDVYKKNKVTMVDFWASWCPPCRAFNPELVKIYKKYHKMGLEIVGVSLDRDHDAWLKGIKDDKLTWYHVSDLKYWQSEVGKLYNVNYIPQNTFVDAEGNIIGRKVAEDEIEAFLDEHLK